MTRLYRELAGNAYGPLDEPVQYTEADAEDIAAWLQAHPADAVAVVRGLKVAGEWEPGDHVAAWYRYKISGDDFVRALVASVYTTATGWWRADIGPDLPRPSSGYVYPTPEEARAAADAALRAAGWALADGEAP